MHSLLDVFRCSVVKLLHIIMKTPMSTESVSCSKLYKSSKGNIYVGKRKLSPKSSLLFSGDPKTLSRMKDQLQSSFIKIANSIQLNKIKLSKTSKYEISDTDEEPYEDSGDSYQPTTSCSSRGSSHISSPTFQVDDIRSNVRRQLFPTSGLSLLRTPSSEESESTDAGILSRMTRITPSPTCSMMIPNCPLEENTPTRSNMPSQLAIVTFKGQNVEVIINHTLHRGQYSCHLNCVKETLTGFLYENKTNSNDHVCSYFKSEGAYSNVGTIVRDKDERKAEFHVNKCFLSPDTLFGMESFFPHMKTNLTPLLVQQHINQEVGPKSCRIPTDKKSKYHFCMYCDQMRTSIGRHFVKCHAEEEEVKTIILLEKQSKARHEALTALRRKSDSVHNARSDPHNRISIRASKMVPVAKFVNCCNCGGLFAPNNYSRHNRICTERPANRQRVLPLARFNTENQQEDSDETTLNVNNLVKRLLASMENDEVGDVVRTDSTLLLYAKNKALQHMSEERQNANTRQQLRRGAKLLIQARLLDSEISEFSDCLDPTKYDTIIETVYLLSGLKIKTYELTTPTVIPHFRILLENCGTFLKSELLKKGLTMQDPQVQRTDAFLAVHNNDFKMKVSKTARINTVRNIIEKNKQLPLPCDVAALTDYIKAQASYSCNKLKQSGFNYAHWCKLGKSVMLHVLIFNRRRVGEISNIRLADYQKKSKLEKKQCAGLNNLEQLLANHFTRMLIMAKRSRPLPVLLDDEQIQYIDLFLSLRKQAGVKEENPYLFGAPLKSQHLSCSVALNEFSINCGAKHPIRLRSTALRKQIATVAQILILNDNEVQQLSDFMGHNIEVHRRHYRQNEEVTQITKLAKFFMLQSGRDLNKFKGKTLDELEVMLPAVSEINDVGDEVDEELFDDLNGQHIDTDLAKHHHENVQPEAEIRPHLDDDESNVSHDPEILLETGETEEAVSDMVDMLKTSIETQVTSLNTEKATTSGNRQTKIRRKKNCSTPDKSPQSRFPTTQEILVTLNNSPRRRKRTSKARWTVQEKEFVYQHFRTYLQYNDGVFPKMAFCQQFAQTYPNQIGHRPGNILYAYIRNVKLTLQTPPLI
ncbi:uncharacterized protein LOC135120308 [Zophobas morio]|uniref:uncharacterized protein LOC135120308 n=2 Tax=Zophobas morio TaxID=2755281 RepID=UPI00308351C9